MTPDLQRLQQSSDMLGPIIAQLELELVDDPAWGAPSEASYLSERDRANPDAVANVQAMAETNKLIAWFGRDAEGYVGMWRGPAQRPVEQAPVVRLDTEGQYSIVAPTIPEYIAMSVPDDEFASVREVLVGAGFQVGNNPDAIWDAVGELDDDPNEYRDALYREHKAQLGAGPREEEEMTDDDDDDEQSEHEGGDDEEGGEGRAPTGGEDEGEGEEASVGRGEEEDEEEEDLANVTDDDDDFYGDEDEDEGEGGGAGETRAEEAVEDLGGPQPAERGEGEEEEAGEREEEETGEREEEEEEVGEREVEHPEEGEAPEIGEGEDEGEEEAPARPKEKPAKKKPARKAPAKKPAKKAPAKKPAKKAPAKKPAKKAPAKKPAKKAPARKPAKKTPAKKKR